MKTLCINRWLLSWISSFPHFNVDFKQCLIALIENWKSAVDRGKSFGALLTDLSKAFDCLPHELLIAKLGAYGFSLSALMIIYSYLFNRQQRTKINASEEGRDLGKRSCLEFQKDPFWDVYFQTSSCIFYGYGNIFFCI